MSEVRVAIIGAGQIGKTHIANYKAIPGAEIVAVCDVNVAEAERVAAGHGIAGVYSDFRELLKRDDVDAVDVCLHNNYHEPVTVAALNAGKHVYCEKPIAGAYADGACMVEAARASGRMLHIQLNRLFSKETATAKELIDAGKLGKLFHARSSGFRRRNRPFVDGYGTASFTRKETAGGGALFDMGVYHISQLLYLLGNPQVSRISGQLYQEMAMDESRRIESGFDVEEFAAGFVKFEGGVTMDIAESWAIHLGGFEGGTIVGSEGGIRLSGAVSDTEPNQFAFHTTIANLDMDCSVNLELAHLRRRRLAEYPDAYESSQHHWIAALRGQAPLLPTAEIALNTMLISEGIYLSHEKGREVTAEETIACSVSRSVRI